MVVRRFVPRVISAEMAAQGYNNEGRGELLGYISDPKEHDESCAHKELDDKILCTCRIGLWREQKAATALIKNMLAMG